MKTWSLISATQGSVFSYLLPAIIFFVVGLFMAAGDTYAMWARLTDKELIAKSDVIVLAELVGQTKMKLASEGPVLLLGVLRVEEIFKGDPEETAVLLLLPSPEAPRASTDILYRKGQRGLWFLRVRKPGEMGLYLADHPQRFLSTPEAADRIEAFRRELQTQSHN